MNFQAIPFSRFTATTSPTNGSRRVAISIRRTRLQFGHRRRGLTLLEIVVAMILLGAILMTVSQLAIGVRRFRLETNQRRLAAQEASNVMEQIQSMQRNVPVAQVHLSDEVQQVLANAKLNVQLAAAATGETQRVKVTISWTTESGQPAAPYTLVAWR